MTEQEVAAHPQRHMLTRAIGRLPTVRVDTAFVELAVGDTLILCSDGLHGEVASETIDADLDAEQPEHAALDAGGKDNVT